MNISKAMSFISENNIKPEELFELVEKVRTMDLSDEVSIRKIIKDVSKLANKPIDKAQENKIVREIMQNGINDNLFNYLK
ncbi:MAG: stage VI sporulation protein F [Bacilli bacterium]|nr:stage VI sporulation protein F [Mollicutes bacterium]MDY3899542.1 stage VI sporulation protein F [Bacilli bacterium]